MDRTFRKVWHEGLEHLCPRLDTTEVYGVTVHGQLVLTDASTGRRSALWRHETLPDSAPLKGSDSTPIPTCKYVVIGAYSYEGQNLDDLEDASIYIADPSHRGSGPSGTKVFPHNRQRRPERRHQR